MILVTPSRKTKMIKAVAGLTPLWTRVRDLADVAVTADDGQHSVWKLIPLCLAHELTGNQAYLDTAKTRFMEWCRDTTIDNWFTIDARFWAGGFLEILGRTFDAVNILLTPAERQTALDFMLPKAMVLWPEIQTAPEYVWASWDPTNNYYMKELKGVAMVGLAARGLDPRADRIVAALRTKWTNEIEPTLSAGGRSADGFFCESTNYGSGSAVNLIMTADAVKTELGDNWFSHPWFEQAVKARVHLTSPDGAHSMLWGAQPRDALAGIWDADVAQMMGLLANVADPKARGWASYWLNTVGGHNYVGGEDLVDKAFIWADPDAPQVDYTIDPLFPLHHTFTWPGLVVKRDSWAADAKYWGVAPKTFDGGHAPAAAGWFCLWKQGPLLAPAQTWAHSGEIGDSQFHNVPVIGGKSQSPGREAKYCTVNRLTRVLEDGMTVEGQGRDTDNRFAHVASDRTRMVVDLADDLIVVWDRVVPCDPADHIEAQWHCRRQPDLTAQTFALGADDYCPNWAVLGTVVHDNPTPIAVDEVLQSVTNGVSSYRIRYGGPGPFLVTVLQIHASDVVPPSLAHSYDADGSLRLLVGDGRTFVVQSPGPTVPNPLPPVKTDQEVDSGTTPPPVGNTGGPPVPVTPPVPRGTPINVYFDTPPNADHLSAIVEGLPAGVTIAVGSEVDGLDAAGHLTGWVWIVGALHGAQPLEVVGNKLTWNVNFGIPNPNTSYTISVVGSDNLSNDATIVDRPAGAIDYKAKYDALVAYLKAAPIA